MSYQDSNLDKQSQNLLCYRYTIAQCVPNFSKYFHFMQGVNAIFLEEVDILLFLGP